MLTNTELANLLAKAAVALQCPEGHKPRDIDSIIADLIVEASVRKEH